MDQDQLFSMSLYVEEEQREEQELSAFILAVRDRLVLKKPGSLRGFG